MAAQISERFEEALDKEIEAIEERIAARESEIEELGMQNNFDEDRLSDLRRKLNKLAAYDSETVDRIFNDGVIHKNKRMEELERQIKRGLSWDEWAAINREYQQEAEKMKESLLTAIESAVS